MDFYSVFGEHVLRHTQLNALANRITMIGIFKVRVSKPGNQPIMDLNVY